MFWGGLIQSYQITMVEWPHRRRHARQSIGYYAT
jgi:hypothetical protein